MQEFGKACAARRCSECCGIISLPGELVNRYRERFQQQPVKELWKGGQAAIITADRRCIFLSHMARCVIYKDRPGVCIMYGTSSLQPCPHLTPEGRRRTREDTRRVRAMIRDAIREETEIVRTAGEA